jgi:ankyrin repeat protein
MNQLNILLESIDLNVLKSNLLSCASLKYANTTFSLLQAAVKFNKVEIVKLLIKFEVNPNQIAFNDNSYPLIEAVCENNVEIVDILIGCENINVNVCNDLLETPLFYACLNGNYKIAKLLIEKRANVNHVNVSGESILSITNDLNIVKLLLDSGANPNLENNCDFGTPLIDAVRERNISKINLFLEYGGKLDYETSNSHSAISVARTLRNKDFVDFLNSKLRNQYFN